MFKKCYFVFSYLFILFVINLNAFNETEDKFPVISFEDWSSGDSIRQQDFKEQMAKALQDFGFFALINHDIQLEDISAVYQTVDAFFSRSLSEKKAYEDVLRNRGYKGFNPNRDDKVADLQEYWHVGREKKGNVWPENSVSFKPALLNLYQKGEKIAGSLLEACAEVIGEPSHFFAERMQEEESVLRIIHYLPPQNCLFDENKQVVWKAPHRDPNLLTLIIGISSEGLEIERPQGKWLSVPLIKNAIIVSSSNMLEHLSNGYFKSTSHRVISQEQNSSRYAFPFFSHLDRGASLEPSEKAIKKTGGTALYPKTSVEDSLKNKSWF